MRISDLLEAKDFKAAMEAIDDALTANPEDDEALYHFGVMMLESEHPGPARVIMERLAKDNPKSIAAWLGVGRCWDELGKMDRAKAAIMRAYKLDRDNPKALVSLSSVSSSLHKWDDAIGYADQALERVDDLQAKINKAFGLLYRGEYAEGWDLYCEGVGYMKWRDRREYAGLPHWNGEEGARVIWYGEQGLGDQIAFMSALPGAPVGTAAINCNPKLRNVFYDTFGVPVFGDQFIDEPSWVADVDATHIAPMSYLHRAFRRSKEAYTGAPYLKVNEDKALMWRSLLERLPRRPNVGIAWTGGAKGSFSSKGRSLTLDAMRPLFDAVDANWIDLEYKDRSAEIGELWAAHGHKVNSWPWGPQSVDFGDVAALVSALDAVVCVPTTVYHAAGALGVPAYVLCEKTAHFHEAGQEETSRYYTSAHLLRRDTLGLTETLRQVAAHIGDLNEVARHHSGRTGARGIEVPGHAVGENSNDGGEWSLPGCAMPAG